MANDIIKTKAITLRYANYREYDRILTLFSPDYGLMTATAHAVRRAKSEIRSCADMFFFGEFVLKKNKKGYLSVSSTDMIDVFYDLRLDINRLSCATYMCDLTRAVALHDHEQNELFMILLKLLSKLCHNKVNWKTVKLKFELCVLEESGLSIGISKCSACGKAVGEFSKLSGSAGGVVCSDCGRNHHGEKISVQAINTLKQLSQMPIENISVIKISDKLYKDINAPLKEYISWHIERTFKSERFMENKYTFV